MFLLPERRFMKLAEFFEKNKWNVECDVKDDHQFVIVHVAFMHERKMEDQVSFDIPSPFLQKEESFKELSECFREFLEDRDEPEVTEIAIVASAETMEKLEETNM